METLLGIDLATTGRTPGLSGPLVPAGERDPAAVAESEGIYPAYIGSERDLIGGG